MCLQVCGSDGVTYHNHCSLHRAACHLAQPVSPLHPGLCRQERDDLLGREEEQLEQDLESPGARPSNLARVLHLFGTKQPKGSFLAQRLCGLASMHGKDLLHIMP